MLGNTANEVGESVTGKVDALHVTNHHLCRSNNTLEDKPNKASFLI